MTATSLGHKLETLHDGITAFRGEVERPIPLRSTDIHVDINAGLATIQTVRTFRNDEDVSIEAILTMPVGFDAVVIGLYLTIPFQGYLHTDQDYSKLHMKPLGSLNVRLRHAIA